MQEIRLAACLSAHPEDCWAWVRPHWGHSSPCTDQGCHAASDTIPRMIAAISRGMRRARRGRGVGRARACAARLGPWADVAGSSRCFMSCGIETVTSSATSGTIQRCGPMRHHMHATRALRWARDAEAGFHDVAGVGWCKQHGRLMLERTFASTNGNEWTCAPGPTTISSSYSGHQCVLRSCLFPAPPAAKERRSTSTCLAHPLHTLTLAPRTNARSRHISSGYGPARCTCGRGEPSPGADVAGASPVPVQLLQGRAQSWWRSYTQIDEKEMSTERFSACDYTQSHESDASVLRYYEIEVLNRPPMHTLACARRVHQAVQCGTVPAAPPWCGRCRVGDDPNDPNDRRGSGRAVHTRGQPAGRRPGGDARCTVYAVGAGGTPPRT
jgi:hypothetical protein